jgi:hypothetical protein
MVSVGSIYYFVLVPLLGGAQNQLSLSQVASIIGTVGGNMFKVIAFGAVAFVGGKYLSSAKQTPAKTTE